MDYEYQALELFKKETFIRLELRRKGRGQQVDERLDVFFDTGKENFIVKTKKELREIQLPNIINLTKKQKNMIVIAGKTFPNTRKAMRDTGINYLDAAGNAFIRTERNYVFIDKPGTPDKIRNGIARAFTKTGVKVVYHLLTHREDINLTVRELAGKTGVANDTIHNVYANLIELEYLVKANRKKYKLFKKEKLLNEWIKAYKDNLKLNILVGRFNFTGKNRLWKDIKLQDEAKWGGEPAGAMITEYLVPAEFTIFTNEARPDILRNYHLTPDEKGNVCVYEKFWIEEDQTRATVHPLLVYADLIITEDPRNIEIANIIYEKHLRDFI